MIENGELEWVLAQYRGAWGWAATQSSTWLEVFDPRWEKVHSWSGCPTWQLSRFTLGLSPRYDVAPRHFDLELFTASTLFTGDGDGDGHGDALAAAAAVTGRVPCREGDAIAVSWQPQGTSRSSAEGESLLTASSSAAVEYTLVVPGSEAVYVRGWGGAAAGSWTKIEGSMTCTLP